MGPMPNSSPFQLLTPIISEHLPVVARRRKSLGDVFQSVRIMKWVRDRTIDSDEPKHPVASFMSEDEMSKDGLSKDRLSEDGQSEAIEDAEPGPFNPASNIPPQLEVLSELNQGNLQRSSTFRTFLEKAATDINVKYGLAQSLPAFKGRSRLPSWQKILPANIQITPTRTTSSSQPEPGPGTVAEAYSTPPGMLLADKATIPSCQSCHSQACCRSKEKRGVPIHQVDKILEQSLHLRDPPQKPHLMEHFTLPRPRGSGNLPDTALSPVYISDNGQKLVEGRWLDNESTRTTRISCPEHEDQDDSECHVSCREKRPVTPDIPPVSPSESVTTLMLPSRAVSNSTDAQFGKTEPCSLIHLRAWIKESKMKSTPNHLAIETEPSSEIP